MPSYNYKTNRHKSEKRWSRAKRLILGVILILLLAATGAAVYFWQSQGGPQDKVVIQPATSKYYSGNPKRVYENDQFKFESAAQWQLSREESNGATKYIFFKQSNGLIEYELDILFDKSASDKAVNYIMPVSIVGNKLKTGPLSDRCGNPIIQKAPKNQRPPLTLAQQYQGVNYICDVLGSKEVAAAGLSGGSYNIPLHSPKGSIVNVNFLFVNDTSSSFAGTFKEVLESFTLK
jgi:hypothetical protein